MLLGGQVGRYGKREDHMCAYPSSKPNSSEFADLGSSGSQVIQNYYPAKFHQTLDLRMWKK